MTSDLHKHWGVLVGQKTKELAFLRELLASLEHDRWSRWMSYLFTKGILNPGGSFTINADSVERWKRQLQTSYVDLSEQEKDSDRKEADNTLALIIKATDETANEPATGDEAVCRMCGETIRYVGPYWEHLGELQPRHPAWPKEQE